MPKLILLSVRGCMASLLLLFSCLFWVVSPQLSSNSRSALGGGEYDVHSLFHHLLQAFHLKLLSEVILSLDIQSVGQVKYWKTHGNTMLLNIRLVLGLSCKFFLAQISIAQAL